MRTVVGVVWYTPILDPAERERSGAMDGDVGEQYMCTASCGLWPVGWSGRGCVSSFSPCSLVQGLRLIVRSIDVKLEDYCVLLDFWFKHIVSFFPSVVLCDGTIDDCDL